MHLAVGLRPREYAHSYLFPPPGGPFLKTRTRPSRLLPPTPDPQSKRYKVLHPPRHRYTFLFQHAKNTTDEALPSPAQAHTLFMGIALNGSKKKLVGAGVSIWTSVPRPQINVAVTKVVSESEWAGNVGNF